MSDSAKRICWCLVVVAAGLLFGTLELQQSLRLGLLAYPPTYDNNGYLIEALAYTKPLLNDSVGAFISRLFSDPPHAPLATLLAIAGFLILGIRDWAPNVMQIVEPVVLLLLLDRIGRGSPWGVRMAVFIAALCVPVSGLLVQENRPDLFGGMLIAAGMTLALRAGAGEAWNGWLAGILMGLAVLAKPTLFPVNTVMIAGTLAVMMLMLAWTGTWREGIRRAWAVALPAVLVPLPYFIVGWRHIADYFIQVVLSPQADNWLLMKPGPLSAELVYYSLGGGGQLMLGHALSYAAIAAALAGLLAAVRKDRGALLLGAAFITILALSYALISIPKLKSPYFGAGFYYLVIFGAAQAIFYIARSIGRQGSRGLPAALAVVVAALALWSFRFPGSPGNVLPNTSPQTAARAWSDALHSILTRAAPYVQRDDIVLLTTPYHYMNEHTLNYINRRDEVSSALYAASYRSNELSDYLRVLGRAKVVVALDPKIAGADLVPEGIQQEIIKRISNDSNLQPIGAVELMGSPVARMYARLAPFSGFTAVSGLSVEERLQGSDSVFRWGEGPATVLQVEFPASGRLTLRVSGTTPDPAIKEIPVIVNGTARQTLMVQNQRVDTSVDLEGAAGKALVTFAYPSWVTGGAADPRKFAVMFQRLQVIEPAR